MANDVLTEQEIKALIDSGDLTPQIAAAKLSPPEKAIYMKLTAGSIGPDKNPPGILSDLREKVMQNTHDISPDQIMGPGTAGILGPAMLGNKLISAAGGFTSTGMRNAVKGAAIPAGMAAVEGARSKGWISPSTANAIETALGLKWALGSGGSAGSAGGSAEAVAEAEAAAKSRLGPGGVFRGRTNDPLQASPGGDVYDRVINGGVPGLGTNPAMSSSAGKTADLDTIAQRILGGKPAYSSNVDTQTNPDLIREMLTGSSSQGVRTPLYYHNGDPEGIRSSVDALKRTVKRRSPGGS